MGTIINQPLVSIGIPTYNRPEGLKRTLDCITQQTYKNLEIIVSDNFSPNPEIEIIVKDFINKGNRVTYYKQKENIGAANNFKFVLEKATGEYFMWAADDDEWNEKFIETCISNIGKNGSVMCNYTCLNRTSNKQQKITLPVLSEKKSTYENLLSFIMNIQPSMFYGMHKRDTILTFLNEDFYDFYDCFFVFRQILNNGFITINEYLYTAGIESDKYVPKPFLKRKNKLFQYRPFIRDIVKVILKTKNLKFKYKIPLLSVFINRILKLFISHETNYRNGQVQIAKFLIHVLSLKKISGFIKKINTDKNINSNQFVKKSYSQSGEDLIIKYIFDSIGIEKPGFIDVGAHHPYYLNNTALFYELGSQGINIEPDPTLFKDFPRTRGNDINLNLGIGESTGEFDFYIMNERTLNTFSKTEAENYSKEGNYFIKDIKKIPVLSFNEMLTKYFDNKFPDFIAIDAEGVDEIILKSIDYSTNLPIVICVETISFSNHGKGIKNEHLIEYIKSKGYLLYADTYINSIFVKKAVWGKE